MCVCLLLEYYRSTAWLPVGMRDTNVSSTCSWQYLGCMGEVCSTKLSSSVMNMSGNRDDPIAMYLLVNLSFLGEVSDFYEGSHKSNDMKSGCC